MKKAISHKGGKKKENRNKQSPKVDQEAVRLLRTVKDNEAFYFYEAIGKPTGEVAKNLLDFLEKVKCVKSESLVFHLQRGDFKNWIQNTLGDAKLAKRLASISPSGDDDARMRLYKATENRLKELKEPSVTVAVQVDTNSTVLLPSC
jgi:hypothetical protein